MARLKSFADAHGLCLLLVHHTRKQNADDKFDMISGTSGLLGAADEALRAGESRERRMLIGRHSFIRQNKLSDVTGRIDYISNPKRQEHLYATYQTEGATPEF